MNLALMTELDALNFCLETIGESPVSSTTDTGLADVTVALRTLQMVSRSVQSEGWHFNTEENVRFIPDTEGYINLGATILRVAPTYPDGKQYSVRGTRLYNLTDRTYVFTQAIYLNIVTFLAFEDLPDVARSYIAIKAARAFQAKTFGSEAIEQFTEDDEKDARRILEEHEGDTGNFNMVANHPALLR